MLKQIEGSRAVAEAIALCRPQVICAYPITPQTHIVEGAGRDGEGRRRSPAASSSTSSPSSPRCRWRSAPRPPARAPTRRPAARACCSWPRRSTTPPGLGLPIVMTIGNRAIGAPINIWNDHSDSMSMRDAGWIQLFAETNQEALDLHIQAFRLAEELSCPVMVCMDGFILTHAYDRVDMPTQDAGRRLPAAVRAAAGARSGRSGDDRRDGRARRRSPRCATSRTTSSCARSTLIPQLAAEFEAQFGRDVRRPDPHLPHRGRRDDRRRAGLGERHHPGSRRRDARRGRRDRLGVDLLVPAVPARRAARGAAATRSASSCSRSASRSAWAASCPTACARRCRASQLKGYTVIAGLGGRAITRASLRAAVRGRRRATSSSR